MANVSNNTKKGNVCFSSYFTDKKGVKHYASEYGLKAFPFGRKKKKKA